LTLGKGKGTAKVEGEGDVFGQTLKTILEMKVDAVGR